MLGTLGKCKLQDKKRDRYDRQGVCKRASLLTLILIILLVTWRQKSSYGSFKLRRKAAEASVSENTQPRVALILVNYNMPERTDKLVDVILSSTTWPLDVVVVDNGSDLKPPSRHSVVRLSKNVQTCNGWLAGLQYAKARALVTGKPYFAYWMMITSAEFPAGAGDVLSVLARLLQDNPNAAMVHPILTDDSTTQWEHMKRSGIEPVRETWMVDNIANLIRADWFESIGFFDARLTYAWGVDVETSYIARQQGRQILLAQDVSVKKVTDIAYRMQRMNMQRMDRRRNAREETCRVYDEKYEGDWISEMFHDPEHDDPDRLVRYWKKVCKPYRSTGLGVGA